MSFTEFSSTVLMKQFDKQRTPPNTGAARVYRARRMGRRLAQTLPNAFDWRTRRLPPVRDQGGCGSCWTFAAASVIESRARISGLAGAADDLSEQQARVGRQQSVVREARRNGGRRPCLPRPPARLC